MSRTLIRRLPPAAERAGVSAIAYSADGRHSHGVSLCEWPGSLAPYVGIAGNSPVGFGVDVALCPKTNADIATAEKVAEALRSAGYTKVRVLGPPLADVPPTPPEPIPAPPAERPYCPQCRERDKVVLPSDPQPERKSFRVPYCRRCKATLEWSRKYRAHRLEAPDFD